MLSSVHPDATYVVEFPRRIAPPHLAPGALQPAPAACHHDAPRTLAGNKQFIYIHQRPGRLAALQAGPHTSSHAKGARPWCSSQQDQTASPPCAGSKVLAMPGAVPFTQAR
jgi:hypothetical protein